jgi:general secretion pathway protein G
MKKSGFTMIELIFVIVILGILAAVAIPKLAATRDDAKIAKGATEVAQLVSDLGAYYTAQGRFSTIENMTNVKLSSDTADMTAATQVYYIANTANGNCLEINTTVAAAADGNFTISYEGTDTSAVCNGIAEASKKITGGVAGPGVTHSFGGSNVNWN